MIQMIGSMRYSSVRMCQSTNGIDLEGPCQMALIEILSPESRGFPWAAKQPS